MPVSFINVFEKLVIPTLTYQNRSVNSIIKYVLIILTTEELLTELQYCHSG